MAERRRVAVTGLGVVTPLGSDVPTVWARLCAGESGVGPIEKFDASGYPVGIAAEVRDFDPDPYVDRRVSRTMDLFCQYAVVAARLAWQDAGLRMGQDVRPERVASVVGSGSGGYGSIVAEAGVLAEAGPRAVNPYYVPTFLINMAAAQVAIQLGITGPSATVATACSAGANAVGDSFRLIRDGEVDVAVCGGAEASVHPLGMAGFAAMRALADGAGDPAGACKPFDRRRSGFVVGEGAGILVLEALDRAVERGAHPYAEVTGYGRSTDAYHMTKPAPDGAGPAAAMRAALADAGVRADEVDYVNAHGTATRLGDLAEAIALREVFGDHPIGVACSSTKSMTGHLLGAAGGVEAVITSLTVHHDLVPATRNLGQPDPGCDLDHVTGSARRTPVRAALTNSFAFGGHNVSLLISKVVG